MIYNLHFSVFLGLQSMFKIISWLSYFLLGGAWFLNSPSESLSTWVNHWNLESLGTFFRAEWAETLRNDHSNEPNPMTHCHWFPDTAGIPTFPGRKIMENGWLCHILMPSHKRPNGYEDASSWSHLLHHEPFAIRRVDLWTASLSLY